MPLRVACPSCSYTDTVPDEAAGKQMKCPQCRVPLILGSEECPRNKDAREDINVSCPICNDDYSVNLDLAGKTIKCRNCMERIRVPDVPQVAKDQSVSQIEEPSSKDEVMEVLPANGDEVEPAQRNSRLRPCPDCGKLVSKRTPQCPNCGRPTHNPHTTSRASTRHTTSGFPTWIIALVGFAFLVISVIAHDIIHSMNNRIEAEIMMNPFLQGKPVDSYTHSYVLAWFLAGTGIFFIGIAIIKKLFGL